MRYVCVAGMHRSGTSLVARVVNLLGVDFGPEDDLMEPKPDNPAGFWESLSISGFNDDLLAELGGRWDRPPMPDPGWETAERFDSWRERAQAIVEERFTGPVAGWKDPRMSLLLPFWQTVVPIDAVVLSIRDPREVAASLAARDGMDASQSAELWSRYVVSGLVSAPEALVVSYRQFFSDLTDTVERIADHLGLPHPDGATRAEISGFFDPHLRHHQPEGSPSEPRMALAVELFEAVESGRPRYMLDELLRGWRAERHAFESSELATRLEHERDRLIGERDQLLEELAGLRGEAAKLHSELDDHRRRLRIKDQALAQREAEALEHGRRIQALEDEAVRLRESLADADARLERLSGGVAGWIRTKVGG